MTYIFLSDSNKKASQTALHLQITEINFYEYNILKTRYESMLNYRHTKFNDNIRSSMHQDQYHQNQYHYNNQAQHHTHEFVSSTQIAAPQQNLLHNHRFAGVTDEAIMQPDGSHTHKFICKTDFTKGHYHTIEGVTSPSIPVGDDRHVHYATAQSTLNASHQHSLRFTVLIDDPSGNE